MPRLFRRSFPRCRRLQRAILDPLLRGDYRLTSRRVCFVLLYIYMPLTTPSGETFRTLARDYLVAGLERGIPSLFVDVKGVYTGNPGKMAVIGEIVEETVVQLQKDAGLHDDGVYGLRSLLDLLNINAESTAPPTTLLWAYYYLALHLSHPLHPNPSHERSLDLLEMALEHTPTLPEVYMAKAMVLKRAGDPLGAAQAMEEARSLDGQDRFLNGKAAKYWLRAGDVKQAEDLVAMFTKVSWHHYPLKIVLRSFIEGRQCGV